MKTALQGTSETPRPQPGWIKLVHPVIILLLVAVLAYGLLLPQMGFYWDELPMSWIRYELGPEALTRYFSTNRPAWGILYQITTSILPQIPIYWEIFALVLRWASAVLVWLIARSLSPRIREFGLIAALLFLLYPGFNQQWTSLLYSHFFVVLCFLLLSFLCSIWAVNAARWRWPLTAAGLLLSGLNLWMMEYFFTLELLRPLLIWRAVEGAFPGESRGRVCRRTLIAWVPYLLVFLSNILWRQLVFNNQVYQPTLLRSLWADPIATSLEMARALALQLYRTGVESWGRVFQFPDLIAQGPRTMVLYVAVVVATGLLAGALLAAARHGTQEPSKGEWRPIWIGLIAMALAGGPFLLTGLEVSTAYPANRFTLPFMLGVSLVLGGALTLTSSRVRFWLAIVLISLAAGRQALWAEDFRHDWTVQKAMFWQMVWRAPGIAPNTLVLLNEGALPYYADNSLIGALNWIYDPVNRSSRMDYALFYPTSRVGGTLPNLEAGQSIHYDFISEVFEGSTSQVLAMYFQPPGCLRLLDPIIDPNNHLIPDASMMREAAALSSNEWVTVGGDARMPSIYGPEPPHGWCYYFERAGLAAQRDAWREVAELGDKAFALDDHPNDPTERFVFIEGYAHTDNWERAIQLSEESYRVSRPYMGPLICMLWQRIEDDTATSEESAHAISKIKSMVACKRE